MADSPGREMDILDKVFHGFLENTFKEVKELAKRSEVVQISPLPPFPPSGYICEFRMPYLRRLSSGVVEIAPGPVLAVLHFPEEYLRSTDPRLYLKVVSVLTKNLTHPNILGLAVCLGSSFAPGTPITALLWELYDIFSYQNVTLDERNALNPEACRLLREHPEALAKLKPEPFLHRKHKMRIKVNTI